MRVARYVVNCLSNSATILLCDRHIRRALEGSRMIARRSEHALGCIIRVTQPLRRIALPSYPFDSTSNVVGASSRVARQVASTEMKSSSTFALARNQALRNRYPASDAHTTHSTLFICSSACSNSSALVFSSSITADGSRTLVYATVNVKRGAKNCFTLLRVASFISRARIRMERSTRSPPSQIWLIARYIHPFSPAYS